MKQPKIITRYVLNDGSRIVSNAFAAANPDKVQVRTIKATGYRKAIKAKA